LEENIDAKQNKMVWFSGEWLNPTRTQPGCDRVGLLG